MLFFIQNMLKQHFKFKEIMIISFRLFFSHRPKDILRLVNLPGLKRFSTCNLVLNNWKKTLLLWISHHEWLASRFVNISRLSEFNNFCSNGIARASRLQDQQSKNNYLWSINRNKFDIKSFIVCCVNFSLLK